MKGEDLLRELAHEILKVRKSHDKQCVNWGTGKVDNVAQRLNVSLEGLGTWACQCKAQSQGWRAPCFDVLRQQKTTLVSSDREGIHFPLLFSSSQALCHMEGVTLTLDEG
jgi:hypothetical protein